MNQLTKARGRKEEAQGLCRTSDAKDAHSHLGQAIRKMIQFLNRLQSNTGRRSIPAALRAELIAAGNGIKDDLRTLRGALDCPNAALSR